MSAPLTPEQRETLREMVARRERTVDPAEFEHPDDVRLAAKELDALRAALARETETPT